MEKMSSDYLRGIRDFAVLAYGITKDQDFEAGGDFFLKVAGVVCDSREEELTEELYRKYGIKRPDWEYESGNIDKWDMVDVKVSLADVTNVSTEKAKLIQATMDDAEQRIKDIITTR